MAKYQRIVTTKAGLQLLAAAVAGGTVTFTAVKTGSGTYTGTEDLSAVSDLKSVQQTFSVSSVTKIGTQVKLRSVLTNDDLAEGYDMTELGVYARNPETETDILYAIIIAESGLADYFPPYEQAPSSITMEFFIELTAAENNVMFTAEALEGAFVLAESFNEHAASVIHIKEAERTAWNAKLGSDGNVSDTTADFAEDATLTTLATGSKLSVLFGTLAKAVSSLIEHLGSKSNPHSVTKEQVGLENVPNVATNDQTPTYTAASANTALTSGEKLSVAFGKIAKAIASLISHLGDTTAHITSTERTAWDSKANGTHTHKKADISDFPTTMTPAAHTHDDRYYTESETNNLLAQKQANLGYAPVQQGTGTGQMSNVVKIGWSGTRLKATVDATDMGNFVFDGQLSSASVNYAKSAGNADTLDGLHAASFIQTSQSAKVIVSATAPADTTAVWIVP